MALASVESLVADVNTFSVILAFVLLSEYDGAPSTGWPPTGYRIPWANTVLDCLQEKSMPELPGGRGNVLPASPIQGTDQSSAGVTGQSKQVPLSEVKASGWFGSRPTLESNQCSLFSYSARLLWFCLADYHLMTERLLALYKAAMLASILSSPKL